MKSRNNIVLNLLLCILTLTSIPVRAQEPVGTQENKLSQEPNKSQLSRNLAPNNIPVPWYSQKIAGCPYSHCSLASSLMVFDYFKGMTTDAQRTAKDAEKKLIEYQKNYFLKKRAPFRRRTSIGQGGYYSFEIDSLARYYEDMVSAEHFQQKDYRLLKSYIDRGIPVLVNVRYTGAVRGLRPGPRGHWMVLRGIDDKHVWVNDPGRSPEMRNKGENICYPIKKQPGNPSYFDGCWTGRFIIVTPKEWIRNSLYAQVGKLPPLEDVTHILPPAVPALSLPQTLNELSIEYNLQNLPCGAQLKYNQKTKKNKILWHLKQQKENGANSTLSSACLQTAK